MSFVEHACFWASHQKERDEQVSIWCCIALNLWGKQNYVNCLLQLKVMGTALDTGPVALVVRGMRRLFGVPPVQAMTKDSGLDKKCHFDH